ncbi:MAG TPA: cytoplasmic protein [Prolixibacteraceae bacterium]|jgi:hypothetical protein|nr:cytoplasmic protein [Prolixibacteraceae bacterium]
MTLIPIIVECHSGYKAGEYPTSFYWLNIRYEIQEISDRWYQAHSTPEQPVANYFKVRTASKQVYILKHELDSDNWFLVNPGKLEFGFSSN